MAAAAAAAVRSALRVASIRSSAAKFATGAKPSRSAFRTPKPAPFSHRVFRSPFELSFCVESMLPYHTATASALLTSMLSAPRCGGWTPEGKDETR